MSSQTTFPALLSVGRFDTHTSNSIYYFPACRELILSVSLANFLLPPSPVFPSLSLPYHQSSVPHTVLHLSGPSSLSKPQS